MADSNDSAPAPAAERWKTARRALMGLAQQLSSAGKIDLQKATGPTELAAFLAKLPTGEAIASTITSVRQDAEKLLEEEQARRSRSFGALEHDFVESARTSHAISERDSGWRIGPVELEFRRETAQCRALYNHLEIVAWRSIGSADDLRETFEAALKKLDGSKIEPPRFAHLLERAFNSAARDAKGGDSPRVPITDVYRALRVEVIADEIADKPDKKISKTEFPRWAFVYNLDLYRKSLTETTTPKIVFETGSQQEQRTLGYSLNGLDALEDTKTFCFMRKRE